MEIDHTIYELQEFLDGGLTGENEAELLHRLSVSPERRELLRSFMKQQSVIAADRAAIAVPYGAEQKLWASLAMLPPVGGSVIATTGAATTEVVSTNVASSLLKAAAVATIGLIIGFSSGYFTGRSTAELSDRVHSERIVVPSVTTSAASVAEISATTPISVSEHSLLSHRSINTSGRKSQLREENLNYPEAPQLSDISRPPSDY